MATIFPCAGSSRSAAATEQDAALYGQPLFNIAHILGKLPEG